MRRLLSLHQPPQLMTDLSEGRSSRTRFWPLEEYPGSLHSYGEYFTCFERINNLDRILVRSQRGSPSSKMCQDPPNYLMVHWRSVQKVSKMLLLTSTMRMSWLLIISIVGLTFSTDGNQISKTSVYRPTSSIRHQKMPNRSSLILQLHPQVETLPSLAVLRKPLPLVRSPRRLVLLQALSAHP